MNAEGRLRRGLLRDEMLEGVTGYFLAHQGGNSDCARPNIMMRACKVKIQYTPHNEDASDRGQSRQRSFPFEALDQVVRANILQVMPGEGLPSISATVNRHT